MKNALLPTLENARKYTLEVAEAMPAEQYHFKPANGIWSFAELLHHIGYGIFWWEENFMRQQEGEWAPPAATTTKKATIAYLKQAFDHLENSPGENEQGFHATIDHITHHRGQATIYLRCQGIEPPTYIY
ncbi:DinB family protein [Chitinophaga parva]|nr:DinB family protein [Chitinophaga parva]